jgi:hypothetical protein
MSRLLGEAFVAIRPDTDGFGPATRTGIDKQLASLHPDVNVGANLAKGDVSKIVNQLKAITKKVDVGAQLKKGDVAQIKGQLKAITDNVQVGVDVSQRALQVMAAKIDAYTKGHTAKVNVEIPATQLAKMQVELNSFLSHKNVADIAVQIPPTQLAKMAATLKAWADHLHDVVEVPVKLRPSDLITMREQLAAFSKSVQPAAQGDVPGFIRTSTAATKAAQAMDAYTNSIIKEMNADKLAADSAKAFTMYLGDIKSELPQVSQATDVAERKVRGIAGAFVQTGVDISAANLAQSMFIQGSTRFGGWWQAATTGIRLWGGMLDKVLPKFLTTISVWHLGVDTVLELAAAWIPATIAMGLFIAAAMPAGKTIYTQWQNINTVVNSLGASKGMTDLGTGFDKLAAAVKPSVYVAFGEALMIAKNNTGPLGKALANVGSIVDNWGAGLVQWAAKGLNGIVTLVQHGGGDIARLGFAFQQLFRILGTIIKDLPGYVKYLLDLGGAILLVTANFVSFISPVLKVGLALHGVIFYIGLATTAIIALGRAAVITGIASFWSTLGTDAAAGAAATAKAAELSSGKIVGLGSAIGGFGGKIAGWTAKLFNWGKDLVGAFKVLGPAGVATTAWETATAGLAGTIGLAAAALVPFVGIVGVSLWLAWKNNVDVMAKWEAGILKIVNNSTPVTLFNNLTIAVEKTGHALSNTLHLLQLTAASPQATLPGTAVGPYGNLPAAKAIGPYAPVAGGKQTGPYAPTAGAGTVGPYNGAGPGLAAQAAQQTVFLNNQLINSAIKVAKNEQAVSKAVGGAGNAMAIANKLGISWNSINKANASQLANIIIKMQAYANTYNYLSQSAGHAASNVAALTFAGSQQLADVDKINKAWDTYLQTLQGGEAAFIPLEQGIQQYNKDLKTTGASMTGLNAPSLQLRQDFLTVSASAESQISALTTYAAVTGGATKANKALANEGIKDVIAQLIPLAKGNKTAEASIVTMAQRADGSIHSWKDVTKWVGNTKNASKDLDRINGILAGSMKNVSQVAGSLAGTLNTLVSTMQDNLLLGVNHVAQKMAALVTTLAKSHGQMTQTAQDAGVTLYKALIKSGMGADQAKVYVLKLAASQGVTGAGLQKLTDDLNAQKAAMDKSAKATANFNRATASLGSAFSKLVSGGIKLTSAAINTLWQNIAKQNLDIVNGKAVNAKAAFMNFANNGLHLTTAKAQELWDKIKQQGLDTLANKAGTTKAKFVDLAHNGLGISRDEAGKLWTELRLQYLDTLATKAGTSKSAFVNLAKQGLDLTTAQANTLWDTLRRQYLDTLAAKAGETRLAFEKTAGQFGLTKGAADRLYSSLHGLAAGSPYGVTVNEILTGSGGLKATISAQALTLSGAGVGAATKQLSGNLGKALKKLARGGVISGGGPAGVDSQLIHAAPGELIIPTTHAAAHMVQAKREGIPGIPSMALGGTVGGGSAGGAAAGSGGSGVSSTGAGGGGLSGSIGGGGGAQGFVSNAATAGNRAKGGVPFIENNAVQFTTSIASGFVQNAFAQMQQKAQAAQAGFSGPLGPATAGSIANGAAIFHYLEQYAHMTPIAAAGAIASIWGESTWNPMAINCVPLTYQIVTTRGILFHDELRVGDQTPTWNPATGRPELATVLDIPYHYDARICRIGNDNWSVVCTWDHKWITDAGLVRADQLHIPDKILVGDGHYEVIEFREDMGTEDTWCVTTTTGTWTTYRDGEAIFTGNSNGRGLIGWTPQGTISDANYRGGLATQLPQILRFISTSGDWGVIAEMNKATSVLQAANLWGKGVERYGINDVHSEGLALATSIMNGGGGAAKPGKVTPAQGLANAIGRLGAVHHFSAGGMVNEPVHGFGMHTGMPYSFAERQSEYVGPLSGGGDQGQGATHTGQMTTNQLLQLLVKHFQQFPQAIAQAQKSGLTGGMRRGAFTTGG